MKKVATICGYLLIYLPVYRGFVDGIQKFVCFSKMSATEEAVISREGTWMRAGENLMIWVCYQRGFCTGVCAPKQKYNRFFTVVKVFYNSVSENFPTAVFVAVRGCFANGENGVQKKHALLCPFCQLAVRGNRKPQFSVKLFVYIL